MTLDLDSLNDNQRQAVLWQDGPLLVVAGPGSGKTRVLTYRIARLIEQSPGARFRVLGVTFTNKAATEMLQRINELVSAGRDRVKLTTFHSLAADILRQHGSHVGLRPDFRILAEQADREALLADAIHSAPRVDADFQPNSRQLLPTIDRLLDDCVPPEESREWLDAQTNALDISAIYAEYRALLIKSNQMDFGTLLATAVGLLESKAVIARQMQRVYPYVCVDECQDTNSAQFRLLVQLVTETSPNLFVVADDDQLIYQWNGASPARLKCLRDRFEMQVLQLPENYRCPPEVILLANNLILHNSDRDAGKSPLSAHKVDDGKRRVRVASFADFNEERVWLAERLAALPAAERPQCVILARRRKLLEETIVTLESGGIPAYFAVRKGEFQSAPYRWLHATLRLASAPQDREQLRRMARAFFQLEAQVSEGMVRGDFAF